jgi:hypothetical protein
VWFCCPETTGLTLEEIDYLFAKGEAKRRMEAAMVERRHSLTTNEKANVIHQEKGNVSDA